MKTKLFVGNLNFETTDEQLRKLFEPYGQIESVTVVTDKRSGRSKGYGFVQMVESKDAAKALEISGQEFMGRDIVVTEADSQGEGEGGRGRRQRSGGGRRHGNSRQQHRSHGSRNHGSNDGSRQGEKKSWWQKLTGIFSFGKKPEKAAARSYDESQPYPRQHRSRNRRNRRYRGGRGRHPSAQGHGSQDRSASSQSAAPSQN